MTRSVVQVRVEPEVAARWRERAAERGMSVSQLVREAMEQQRIIATSSIPTVAAERIGPGPVSVTVRTTSDPARPLVAGNVRAPVPCSKAALHRSGTFCRYCGRTP